VTGALLRFDRELERTDQISTWGFAERSLRMSPANTLRLEGGRLWPDESVTYDLAGAGGPPRLLAARWIVDGRIGREVAGEEIELR
jgi:hypothetical protein